MTAASAAKEIAPFLRNLRRMLDTEHASIICWTPEGVAFEIHDVARLVSHVLPKYFKHAKYSSFQRQLNYFHFRKWTRSKTAVCTFSNPHFQRDAPELAWRITRKKSLPVKKPSLSIAVPKVEVTAPLEGFQSPTDVVVHGFSPLLPELDGLQCLDWIDSLYSSLETSAPRLTTLWPTPDVGYVL